MKYWESIAQLATGLWVGAMTGFAATAPLIFRAFGPDRQRAGDLAGSMIYRLNSMGIALGLIALVALLPRLKEGWNRWRALLLTGALLLSLAGTFYIFPKMEEARPPRPIQEYAETDPVRVNYNRWHRASERLFGVAILMAGGALLLGPLGSGANRKEAN
jgi:MFS family permease